MTHDTISHPIPNGSRVHHKGGIYSYRKPRLAGYYWGVVLSHEKRGDTWEYEIEANDGSGEWCGGRVTWWASYHIDQVLAS